MTEGTADTPPMPPMDSSFRMSGVGEGNNGDGDGRMGGCSLVNVVSPIWYNGWILCLKSFLFVSYKGSLPYMKYGNIVFNLLLIYQSSLETLLSCWTTSSKRTVLLQIVHLQLVMIHYEKLDKFLKNTQANVKRDRGKQRLERFEWP